MNTITISRWGNSLALRIPKGVIENSRLKEGDALNIESINGVITLKKIRKIKRYSLKDALKSFHSTQEVPEMDWGKNVGKEVLDAETM